MILAVSLLLLQMGDIMAKKEYGRSTATPYGFLWTVTGHHTGSNHSPGTGNGYESSSVSYSDGTYCGYGDTEPNNMFAS